MFLCNECIKKYKVNSFWGLFSHQSAGLCEGCGKYNVCADIHHSKIPVPEKKKPKSKNQNQ